ncbi:MAG: hypothetical protein U1F47_05220 [Hyphomicrobiales bacterium]
MIKGIERILDCKLIAEAAPALEHGKAVEISTAIRNADRTAGAMLSGEVARRYGHAGLPEDTIRVTLTGIAGQSFGAWAAHGVTPTSPVKPTTMSARAFPAARSSCARTAGSASCPKSIIVGNTVLYGAITGDAGQRRRRTCFAVRNSGAVAVVEKWATTAATAHRRRLRAGHRRDCQLRGRHVGGVAYVLDETGDFAQRRNLAMVDLQPVPAEDELEKLHHAAGDLHNHGLVDVT